MEKFIPFEKLSKKKQRELNSLRRTVWAVSPVTRRPEDPKAYKRTKTQNRKYDDSDSASFAVYSSSALPAVIRRKCSLSFPERLA